MKRPILKKPKTPVAPERNIKHKVFKTEWHDSTDISVSHVMQYIEKMTGNACDPKLLRIEVERDYGYDGSEVTVWIIHAMPWEEENQHYDYDMKSYKAKLKRYETRLKEYDANLPDYKVRLKEYQAFSNQKKVDELEKQLEKLKSKQKKVDELEKQLEKLKSS